MGFYDRFLPLGKMPGITEEWRHTFFVLKNIFKIEVVTLETEEKLSFWTLRACAAQSKATDCWLSEDVPSAMWSVTSRSYSAHRPR